MDSNQRMISNAVAQVYKQILACMRDGIAKCTWTGVGYSDEQLERVCLMLKPFFPHVVFTPSKENIDAKWWWELK